MVLNFSILSQCLVKLFNKSLLLCVLGRSIFHLRVGQDRQQGLRHRVSTHFELGGESASTVVSQRHLSPGRQQVS